MKDHIDQALISLHEKAGFYFAEQYGLLLINGKDSSSFLQSQLTNNINELKPGAGQFSCLLDRKAHVEAYFHLYRDSEKDSHSFYVLLEKDQISPLIEHLEQYRFAAQVDFSDCSSQGSFVTTQGPRAAEIFTLLAPDKYLNEIRNHDMCDTTYGDTAVKLFRHSITGENGYFFWVNNSHCNDFGKTFEKLSLSLGFTKLTDELIEQARIEAGLATYGVDFNKKNLLPETGLVDQTVNFKKGCFVGQEVLARIKSHGIPSRGIMGLRIDCKSNQNTALPINSPIIVEGKEIGTIKSNTVSPRLKELIALAILNRDCRVPERMFVAQIAKREVTIVVTLLPFVHPRSNTVIAHKLYQEAVQKFVKDAENAKQTEAVALLQEVLILDPKFEDAYEALAVILSKQVDLTTAIDLMKALAELNVNSIMAHSNLSQFYVQQGLKELAEEEKAIALSIRMQLAAAQFTDQKAQAVEIEKEKADRVMRREMFEQVLSIDKDDFFANAGVGECLVADNDFDKAIPYLKRAIELKEIHLASYLDLVRAYKALGLTAATEETLAIAIALASKRNDMPMLQKLRAEMQ